MWVAEIFSANEFATSGLMLYWVFKFPGIYSPWNICGNISGNISKLGINGNKYQSVQCIKTPNWNKFQRNPSVKIVFPVNFGSI